MKHSVYCCCIISFLFLAGCRKDRSDTKVIRINPDQTSDFTSDIIREITLTPLQTSEETVISGHITHIEADDRYVYAVDYPSRYAVLVFDHITGEFIRELGKIGRGPGEAIQYHNFHVTNDFVVVPGWAPNKRVYLYNKQWELVRDIETTYPFDNFIYLNGKYFMYIGNGTVSSEDKHYLLAADEQFKVKQRFFEKSPELDKFAVGVTHLKEHAGDYYLLKEYSDTIYRINDTPFYPAYRLDFGKRLTAPDNIFRKFHQQDIVRFWEEYRSKYPHFIEYAVTDNYLFVSYRLQDIMYCSVYDKNSRTTTNLSLSDNPLGFLFQNIFRTEKNEIMSIVSAKDFTGIVQFVKDNTSVPEHIRNAVLKYENITSYDNHIIVKIKLKSNSSLVSESPDNSSFQEIVGKKVVFNCDTTTDDKIALFICDDVYYLESNSDPSVFFEKINISMDQIESISSKLKSTSSEWIALTKPVSGYNDKITHLVQIKMKPESK